MVVLGVVLHALGGFAVGSFYIPFKKVRNWAWESYWLVNGVFSALAGVTWYLQFMFHGMGRTKMGKYDFSSWTIHMAFIIIFSSIWGLIFREWKGSSRKTHRIVFLGMIILITSTFVVGMGTYLELRGR